MSDDGFEQRLDDLRREAERHGSVAGEGARIHGGPLPARRPPAGADTGSDAGSDAGAGTVGYYGLPALKPPVWTWEVPLYFFAGGLAGMSAVVALAALAFAGDFALVRAALLVAALAGGVVSPVLLTLDLGRPARFLNMLRVLKLRSPMSVGAFVLTGFGACAVPAAVCAVWYAVADAAQALVLTWVFTVPAAVLGTLLATYTGVLLGATAVPAWLTHRRILPLHFGVAGLGSAAATLELLAFDHAGLRAIGLAAAAGETCVGVIVELHRRGAADRVLRRGTSNVLLRAAGLLSGPTALLLRILGLHVPAAIAFLLGALVSRYGWLAAGRRSARDPAAAFAVARPGDGDASASATRGRASSGP